MTQYFFVFLVFLLVACRENVSSEVTAIGTDLPDDGGEEQVYLYYVSGNKIYQGLCPDRHNILRTRCPEIGSMRYDLFKADLDGGLSQTIRDLTEESRRIQLAIDRINDQIGVVQTEIDELERGQGHLSRELQVLRAKLNDFESLLVEYRQELVMIDEALSRITDRDIELQRQIVISRIQEYQSRVSGIDTQISAILLQLDGIGSQLGNLQRQISSLHSRLGNLQVELVDVTARLASAHSDFSIYEDTMRRLNDGFIYQVLGDNELLQRQRLFVRRFYTIFEQGN